PTSQLLALGVCLCDASA
ncbi:DUF645 family protein, partial [Vibrio cholerae]|nr:DUF645 family protein [Vibrio cholerae]